MCTVSIVPMGNLQRLVCNRDERMARPDAHEPVMRQVGDRKAFFPVDPAGGGTWIGINDAGIALALLNRSVATDSAPRPRLSRGTIIPSLLGCGSFAEVVGSAMTTKAEEFQPFRLVALAEDRVAVIGSDGCDLSLELGAIDAPRMFTSSSLGDAVVEGPRQELFERLVLGAPSDARLDAQRRFHRHQWASQPAISVLMSRSDARTVSRTVIDMCADYMLLRYRPLRIH